MAEVWYSLLEHVDLRKRRDYCLVIDKYLNKVQILHPAEALVLSLLDGCTTFDELAYLITETYGMEEKNSRTLIENVLREFRSYLKSTTKPQPKSLRYAPENFVFAGFQKRPDGKSLLEAPVELALVLTRRCNFGCLYCVYGNGPQPKEELKTDVVLRLIEEAAYMGVATVNVTGGEPTLHPALQEIVSAVIGRKMECFLSTNGSLLDERMTEALAASGLHTVQVSIDSPSADMHHFLTQSKNTFNQVLNGIRRLKAHGLRVRTRSVITPQNYHQITELIDLLIEHEVDHIDLCTERIGSCESMGINKTNRLSREQMASLQAEVKKGIARHPERKIFFVNSDADWSSASEVVRCGSLTSVMIVHSNGNVSVCEMIREDPELSYGNIHQSALKEIWAGPAHQQILKRSIDRSHLDQECAVCGRLGYCATGCFNRSKLDQGSYFAKDPRCPGAGVVNATMSDGHRSEKCNAKLPANNRKHLL